MRTIPAFLIVFLLCGCNSFLPPPPSKVFIPKRHIRRRQERWHNLFKTRPPDTQGKQGKGTNQKGATNQQVFRRLQLSWFPLWIQWCVLLSRLPQGNGGQCWSDCCQRIAEWISNAAFYTVCLFLAYSVVFGLAKMARALVVVVQRVVIQAARMALEPTIAGEVAAVLALVWMEEGKRAREIEKEERAEKRAKERKRDESSRERSREKGISV